jgi:hypothetical protein
LTDFDGENNARGVSGAELLAGRAFALKTPRSSALFRIEEEE